MGRQLRPRRQVRQRCPGFSRGGHDAHFTSLEYTQEQLEWLRAVDALKRRCPHPDLRQAFRLALALGYRKVAPPRPLK